MPLKNRQALSGAGVHAFVENLREAPPAVEEIENTLAGLAEMYGEEMPADPALQERIEAARSVAHTLKELTEGLYPAGRAAHAKDYERTDSPRGSHGRETKADVVQAQRDGVV
jgi:hypothetical protein